MAGELEAAAEAAGEEETVVDQATVDQAAQEAAAQAAQEQAAIEGRARRMGWRPMEEFRGDRSRWTDAKSFVERGEAELPVLRERYRALDDRFAQLEYSSEQSKRELQAQLAQVGEAFNEFRVFAQKADERSYQRAKTDIEARMAAAVQTADTAGFSNAQSELRALEQGRTEQPVQRQESRQQQQRFEQPDQRQRQQAPIHPDVIDWVSQNPWFNSDPAMASYATALHGRLLVDKPGMTMRENLDEVRADVVARFPEKFGNARREESSAVVTSKTGTPVKPAKKGKYPEFKDWPSDARQAYEKFARAMPGYTKEEYAKTYFAGDEQS